MDDRGQTLSIPMYLSIAWEEIRICIDETNTAWDDNTTGPANEVNEDPNVLTREFWVPDLEIYGLEKFGSKKVLKEMSGLRIKKSKTLEFNTKYELVKHTRTHSLFSGEMSYFLSASSYSPCSTSTYVGRTSEG